MLGIQRVKMLETEINKAKWKECFGKNSGKELRGKQIGQTVSTGRDAYCQSRMEYEVE